jgi:hypothetical protein
VLDDFLPGFDVHDVHATTIAAPPAAVMDAVRQVTAAEVPLLVVLMAIRRLPALGRARWLPRRGPLLDAFTAAGFVVLRDAPDELVLGVIGRFWRPSGDLRTIDPAEFRDFAEPGWAKAAINFRVERRGARTVLTTETRVAASDASAGRRFRCYWRVIYPGSAAIRIAWLRAIRRRAERAAASPAAPPAAPAHSARPSA